MLLTDNLLVQCQSSSPSWHYTLFGVYVFVLALCEIYVITIKTYTQMHIENIHKFFAAIFKYK